MELQFGCSKQRSTHIPNANALVRESLIHVCIGVCSRDVIQQFVNDNLWCMNAAAAASETFRL